MLCNMCIYVRQVKSCKYAETPWTGENSQACPSAVLLCKHTLSSSRFSHCLRGWLKLTMSGRRNKHSKPPSSIKHHFFHEHQSLKTSSSTHRFFHQSPQLLFPVTEPELQQQQVKYWDDELHLVFV